MKKSNFPCFASVLFALVVLLCTPVSGLQAQTTFASWTFPNNPDDALVDVADAANAAATLSTQGGTSANTYAFTGLTTNSASATGWDNGSGSKWWQINIVTTGYFSLDLSSKQTSSATGPRDFKVQYRIGASGTWTDLTGATSIVCSSTTSFATSARITNVALPSSCDDQPSVFIRWIMTTNEDAQSTVGNVAGGGTSRIDDIVVRGNTGGHYRSLTSGNWNSTSSWQTSADLVTWYSAIAPPDLNANTITIRSGHTITINTAVTADQITVDLGGTLLYNSGSSATIFTLNNGSGVADLIVNGTFLDSPTSSTAGFAFATGATWSLGSNGTYVKTAGTSAAVWRDNYQGGISSIPATANWIVRKSGATVPAMSTTGGMYYPNLTIESDNGTWGALSTNNFSGNSDYPRVLGNLDIGGSGTQAVSFINDVVFATPVYVGGNLIVRNGSSLTLGGASNGCTGFEVQGNLQVDGTLQYNAASTGTRLMRFSGGNAQTISGSGTINLFSLEVNKSANSLTLSRSVPVDGILTLTQGLINSTSSNLLQMSSSSSASGGSSSSFVNGPLEKTGSTNFTFPVGNSSYYRPVSILNLSGSDTYKAAYFPSDPTSALPVSFPSTSLDPAMDHVSSCEYWTLEQTGSSSAAIDLSWGAPCNGVTMLSTVRVAAWAGGHWVDLGNSATTGAISPATGTVTSALTFTNFAALTLASSTADNPLPITLVDFTGKAEKTGNELHWTSSSEINNDHFFVERSQDMLHFESIGKVKGNGSTDAFSYYTFTDNKPFNGINYYRLRQFDFDGSNDVSHVIAIDASSTVKTYTLIYDAANQQLLLRLQATESTGEVTIIDLLGRKRLSQALPAGQAEHGIACNQLEHGIYFLLIQHDGETQVQKFFY